MFEDLKEPYEQFQKVVKEKYPNGCEGLECVKCDLCSGVDTYSVTVCYALRSAINRGE